jgi:hypothetical protein
VPTQAGGKELMISVGEGLFGGFKLAQDDFTARGPQRHGLTA